MQENINMEEEAEDKLLKALQVDGCITIELFDEYAGDIFEEYKLYGGRKALEELSMSDAMEAIGNHFNMILEEVNDEVVLVDYISRN
jgi:hypothetical protein